MEEWLDAIAEGFRAHSALAGRIALISFGVAVIYAVVMFWALAWMRPDYFVRRRVASESSVGHPLLRPVWHMFKNLIGALLLLTGIAMIVLPGQGMLTILVALTLLDFPGKRRLILRIVRLKRVHSAIDWIRRRAGRPPILLPARGKSE